KSTDPPHGFLNLRFTDAFEVDFSRHSGKDGLISIHLSPGIRRRQTRREPGARETAGVSRSRAAVLRLLKILKPTMSLSPRLARQRAELPVREPFPQSAFYLFTEIRKKNRTFENPRIGTSRFI